MASSRQPGRPKTRSGPFSEMIDAARLDVVQLSAKSGVSTFTIYAGCRGKTPRPRTVEALARAMRRSVEAVRDAIEKSTKRARGAA